MSDLIISGVIDGPITGGLPKAIELYAINNITDLSIYGVGSANNGAGSGGQEFTFPADSVSAGDYIYLATESTEFNNFFGFNPDYVNILAPNINGNDAIELFLNGTVVDVFGDISVDGTGQPWEYTDGWAYRNDATSPDGTSFNISNWSFSSPDALDGETSNGTATTPFPTGTFNTPNFSSPITNPFNLTNLGTFSSPTFVDIDGDLDLDAFVGIAFPGRNGGNTYFYENIGTATTPDFGTPKLNHFGLTIATTVPNSNFSSPTFVDINGDTLLDAFVGAWDGNTYYYPNIGTATVPDFSTGPQTNPFGLTDVGTFSTPTFVDIDGDGDPDAFVGANDGNTYYYENIGDASNPNFDTPQTNPFNLTDVGWDSNPSFVDVDGDGDADAFVGEYDGNTYYYQNTGDVNNPTFAIPVTNPFNLTDVGFFNSPTFVDIDGDGDADAFLGAQDGNLYFYENQDPPGNNAPTDITLSNTAIYEGVLAETVVGTFSTTDANADDTFTYELVSGTGDTDNVFFTITDNYLTINFTPDFETQPSYSILVQTTDQWGGTFDKQLTVTVNDLAEIDGTPSSNTLRGSASNELFRALAGNDRIYAADGNDLLDGGDGTDMLHGGSGQDILYGGRGNDRLYGDAGNDSLLGGDGSDFIIGGDGDDLLDGGAGSDRLYGNGGNDTFVLEAGMGRDFIYSFENGSDSIQLAGGLTFDELEITGTTGYTQIKIADTGEFLAMLPGVDVALIEATDFTTSPL